MKCKRRDLLCAFGVEIICGRDMRQRWPFFMYLVVLLKIINKCRHCFNEAFYYGKKERKMMLTMTTHCRHSQ